MTLTRTILATIALVSASLAFASGAHAQQAQPSPQDNMEMAVKFTGPAPAPVQVKRTKYEVISLRGQQQDDRMEEEVAKSLARDANRRQLEQAKVAYISRPVSARSGAPVKVAKKKKIDRMPAGITPPVVKAPKGANVANASKAQAPAYKAKRRIAKSE